MGDSLSDDTGLSDEHHDWASSFTGIDTRGGSSPDATAASGDTASGGLLSTITGAVSDVSTAISQNGSSATEAAAPPEASTDGNTGDGNGSPGVLSSLGNAVSSVSNAVSGATSSAVNAVESGGKAVASAETAQWDSAKSTYNAVTGAYDSVAPDFTKSNKDLGEEVDKGEEKSKEINDKAAAEYADVPVIGTLAQASSSFNNVMTEATGGVVKGVGDLASMAGNAFFHPVDAAVGLGQGALGIAEHVPLVPGLNTTVKGIEGLADLAQGKKDGEYGDNLTDLGENLLLDTKQDPNDPSKRTNADIGFLASMGGGTKTWTDKPVEAATRTITNLVPMLLGDEAGKAPPEDVPPVPEEGPPPPADGPPQPKTVDLGKTQPNAKTLDLGNTQPNAPADGPPAESDPPKSQPDPDPDSDPKTPKGSPEAAALQQAEQDLADAQAVYDLAKDASGEATGESVRYRASKPDPAKGITGDPNWDPAVNQQLIEKWQHAHQMTVEAINNLRAAERALQAAEKRAGLAR